MLAKLKLLAITYIFNNSKFNNNSRQNIINITLAADKIEYLLLETKPVKIIKILINNDKIDKNTKLYSNSI